MEAERAKKYEEYAYVLDFLPYGRSSSNRPRHMALPTIQMIGENYFTLLEAELKFGATASAHERVYVGRERREKVDRVIGRITYDDLTATAKAEIGSVIEDMILKQEQRFVAFFNNSQPVTPRMHALELLPGIGKKLMWQIINEREKKPFVNFQDIKVRTGISDPAKLIARRILEELSGEAKYRLFTRTA
jgi:putative nucleotide binding protein